MIYLDHHATTAVDERVLHAMLPFFVQHSGNPGSPHAAGRHARDAVELARYQVAAAIGAAEPAEIVFTSGATESNNLALRGVLAACADLGRHLVTTTIEHNAVLQTAAELECEGWRVTRVPVNERGLVAPEDFEAAIGTDTALVSVMLANNEIGTVQPIAEIGEICRARGVLVHVDAVQGIGKVPFDVESMNVDLASISAHKMYGPKGVGALYVRSRGPCVRLVPELAGGGQEGGLRPGTLNVPGIVGFGAAAALAAQEGPEEARRLRGLRERLWARLRAPGVRANGDLEARLPGNTSVCVDVLGRPLVEAMDRRGVACSTGSACSTGRTPSHVLLALGRTPREALSGVRFGLGRRTTETEIDEAARVFHEALAERRSVER